MDAPPPDTFVGSGAHDPLHSSCSDLFWYNIEPSFRPFVEEDVRALRALAVTHDHALPADELRAPALPDAPEIKPDDALACVRSFPISHRLVAALLDEGKGAASAARTMRSAPAPEPAWLPGTRARRLAERIVDGLLYMRSDSCILNIFPFKHAAACFFRGDDLHKVSPLRREL